MKVHVERQCVRCGQGHSRSHKYCAACHAAYMREWRKTHRLSPQQATKANARAYAREYLKRGRLLRQPCEECGCGESQMHHLDYSKPLEVHWLCRPCHLAHHRAEAA